MDRRNPETVGVRRTGWAALDRDPQLDTVGTRWNSSVRTAARGTKRTPGANVRCIISRMVFCRICRAKSRSAMPASSICAWFLS